MNYSQANFTFSHVCLGSDFENNCSIKDILKESYV